MNHEKRCKCKKENETITIYDVRLKDPLMYMINEYLSIGEKFPLLFVSKYFNQLIFDTDKQKIKKNFITKSTTINLLIWYECLYSSSYKNVINTKSIVFFGNLELLHNCEERHLYLSPLLHFCIWNVKHPKIKYNIYLYRDDIPNDVWRLRKFLDENIIWDDGSSDISLDSLLGSWFVNQKVSRTPEYTHKSFEIIVDIFESIDSGYYEEFVQNNIDYINERLKEIQESRYDAFISECYKDMDLSPLSVKSFLIS